MKTKYFLTENGNILNVEKGCFQTPYGQFLRRVFESEFEYLRGELIPVEFPAGIKEPELPIWSYMWDVEGEYTDQYEDTHECFIVCFTRQISGLKREFSVLYVPKYTNIKIVDTDVEVFVEDYENEDGVGELATYAQKVSILTIWTLGEPDLSERVRRYKVLKRLGIKLPYEEHLEWLKRRKRKVARKWATA